MSAESEILEINNYVKANYPSYVREDETIAADVIRVFEALEVELGKCLEGSHDVRDDDSK